jgi:hypothetical protein
VESQIPTRHTRPEKRPELRPSREGADSGSHRLKRLEPGVRGVKASSSFFLLYQPAGLNCMLNAFSGYRGQSC